MYGLQASTLQAGTFQTIQWRSVGADHAAWVWAPASGGSHGLYFSLFKTLFRRSLSMSTSAVAYAQENHPRFLSELKDLLRIPSISTAPEHAKDCRHAAEVLVAELGRIGMENPRI